MPRTLRKTGYKVERQEIPYSSPDTLRSFQTFKSGTSDYYVFLEETMTILFDTFNIERGCICLWDENLKEYEVAISRGKDILDSDGNLRTIPFMLNKVLNEKIPVLTVDTGEDACLKKRKSKGNFNNKPLMCLPLITQNKTIGFIYIDKLLEAHSFADRDLKFLRAFTRQIAISIGNIKPHIRIRQENINAPGLQKVTEKLIGNTPPMRKLYLIIDRFSKHNTPILINGEIGTEKELVAKTLHHQSSRRSQPFIRIFCASSSKSIIESDLFGFEKGAFPGALETKKGKLELADKGTLFLDEITEISPAAQVRLLSFLKKGEVERIGDYKPIPLDVRVIAASSRNLADAVTSGTFREDLYYRLNPTTVVVPPLRSRKADIPLFVEFYLEEYCKQIGKKPMKISQDALDSLLNYDWPGNIRELKNIIERAVTLGKESTLRPQDFPEDIVGKIPFMTMEQIEIEHIKASLKRTNGNVAKAASLLDIARSTLFEKIRYKHIDSSLYRNNRKIDTWKTK